MRSAVSSRGALAGAPRSQHLVRCGEGGALSLGAVFPHIAPHQVKEPAGAGDPLALADLTEGGPCVQRHAEALDRRFAGVGRCHIRNRTATSLCCHRTLRYCCHMTTTAAQTTTLAPGTRIIRTHTPAGQSDLTVPSWAAQTLAAEKATQPDVLHTEVIGTGGGVEATFTAVVPLPPASAVDAELAFLDALLFCTGCGTSHLPSVACPGPCPTCFAAAGVSCASDCLSRFLSYDEIGE